MIIANIAASHKASHVVSEFDTICVFVLCNDYTSSSEALTHASGGGSSVPRNAELLNFSLSSDHVLPNYRKSFIRRKLVRRTLVSEDLDYH